jgi:uncharacterized membrane protein YoaK (UPF0700 family)
MDAATGIVDDQTPLVRTLIGLTVITGLVDAISFLGLGRIFTANMTGNVVFLGFAAGGAPGISAARSIAALCAFAGGSVCGGRFINSRERTPIARLLITTYVETALLLTAAGAAAADAAATEARESTDAASRGHSLGSVSKQGHPTVPSSLTPYSRLMVGFGCPRG